MATFRKPSPERIRLGNLLPLVERLEGIAGRAARSARSAPGATAILAAVHAIIATTAPETLKPTATVKNVRSTMPVIHAGTYSSPCQAADAVLERKRSWRSRRPSTKRLVTQWPANSEITRPTSHRAMTPLIPVTLFAGNSPLTAP